ncbi:MAG: class I SAM-dependent methyltransferase [Deltaproteobacteria bacterium]|nr:class I SAM-dependent methyltransferase [Deltaproteobacteria bacterium]
MSEQPLWQYDELKHSGVDYADPAQAQVFDTRHQRFRDYEEETRATLELLEIRPEHTIIDMGVGTGSFALNAARHCRKIFAVDVSEAMLDLCQQKARTAGIENIEFRQGGFLTYEHAGEPADAITCSMALHHLPDFWKLIGLRRLNRMLRTGGKSYLSDVVFSFDPSEYQSAIDGWVESTSRNVCTEFKEEVEAHIRDEYSTFDWIMEGLLDRAGFTILEANYLDEFLVQYRCVKKPA